MTAALGCLILHGFTSSLDTVRALVPVCERLGLPYRMPVLRGHGTRPADLRGVTWQDWYDDAHSTLRNLCTEVDRVVLCGLSMGGLVALHLAANVPEQVAGVITIAAALEIADPLVRLAPLGARLGLSIPSNPAQSFADPTLVARSTNYRRFPLDALVSLYRYGPVVQRLLPQVQAPLLVIHSRNDQTIKPRSATIIYERAGSVDKQLRWFDTCRHQMLQDCEADAVVATIEGMLKRIADRQPGAPAGAHARPSNPPQRQ